MTLTIEQLHELSHFFNAHPNLPVRIQVIADQLKESLHPTQVEEKETKVEFNKK